MRKLKPYELQLKRVKRTKIRIERIITDYRKGKYSEDFDFLCDQIFSFFIFCHHLKDYIISDESIDIEKKIVESNIKSNECLKICADICNGTKHLKLNMPRTKDGDFSINLQAKRDKDAGGMTVKVNMKSNTVKEDFSKLADECIQKWEEFIKKEIESKPKKQIEVNCPNCSNKFEVDYDFIMVDCPKCGQKKILI